MLFIAAPGGLNGFTSISPARCHMAWVSSQACIRSGMSTFNPKVFSIRNAVPFPSRTEPDRWLPVLGVVL